MIISASILACDTAFIGDTVIKLKHNGADIIHVDIMDGHYVGNLTFGPQTVRDIKKLVDTPIEAHLEIDNPQYMIEAFAKAGADIITVQLDSCVHPIRTLQLIKDLGKKSGLAISPGDGIERLEYLADKIDYLLLMSVEPGFGGQPFERSVINKIIRAKELLKRKGITVPIAVDGGITPDIAKELKYAGADVLIIGTSLFASTDLTEGIKRFKEI